VGFLLIYHPFCCLACQTPLISVHEAPGMVKEPTDHIHRTCIKAFACGPLGLLKPHFVDFSISMLAPAPILSNRMF